MTGKGDIVAISTAPLARVAWLGVVQFLSGVYKRAVSYPQTTQPILVPCDRKMISSGLFGKGKDSICA